MKGKYFNARNFRGDKKVIERIDPQVAFEFGGESPDPAKIGKDEFAIQWQGGVMAEETGEYEFCLKADNGARLWVNDMDKPLIDAWVKSGDELDHVASIRLLGGRVYPIRVGLLQVPEQDGDGGVALDSLRIAFGASSRSAICRRIGSRRCWWSTRRFPPTTAA